MADAKHTPLFTEAEASMMEELRYSALPRRHRDAGEAMSWAADEIQRLRTEKAAAPDLLAAAKLIDANVDAWRKGGTPDYRLMMEAQDTLRAAIAKATVSA